MSLPQEKEKALKTFVVGESGLDAPLGLGTQETDRQGWKEPKRTWKSYIWSCEPPPSNTCTHEFHWLTHRHSARCSQGRSPLLGQA